MKRLTLGVLFISSLFSIQSFAQSYAEGGAAALKANHNVIEQLNSSEIDSLTQYTLNVLVREANHALVEKGYAKEAQEYQSEWNREYSNYFMAVQLFDLGNHKPLNAWLADFYKKLQYRLGDPLLKFLHLDDINSLNYAVPVVFQPKGDRRNGDHWNAVEYGKHFVPFASIVTYWSAYIGCRAATTAQPVFRRFCGVAASTLKTLMKTTFAPKLSNVVYSKMTGKKADLLAAEVSQYENVAAQKVNEIPREEGE